MNRGRNAPPAATLACIGDLLLDVVVRPDGEVEPGTDVRGTVRFRQGGSAANTARAFAGLGGRAVFIGAVGDDAMGGRLLASLRAAGVTVHAVRVRGASGRLLALIEAGGERSFVTDRGVADSLPVKTFKDSWIARVDAVHVPAYSLLTSPLAETAFHAIAVARPRALVSIDLASRAPFLARGRHAARRLIARAAPDIVFANTSEVEALVGSLDPAPLAELAPIVVIKHGAQGSHVIRSGAARGDVVRSVIATKPIAARDTTGAGDAFDAGFLQSLLASGYHRQEGISDAVLRRAALAGHRSATQLLRRPRVELVL